MNRAELQRLARERIRDAKILLANRRWSGAYYLAGYAVECGFKSCVIAYLMRTDDFPEKTFSVQCWTHDLPQLLKLASLQAEFKATAAADSVLAINWELVKDWKESSRYERRTRTRAQKLFNAITDKKHGVLPWITSRW
jgi:HEPN domain-containing protein